jgi:hypothetical protein
MKEEALYPLSMDELLAELIQATNDLIAMQKRHDDKNAISRKLKDIQLLQRIIVAKRLHSNAEMNS